MQTTKRRMRSFHKYYYIPQLVSGKTVVWIWRAYSFFHKSRFRIAFRVQKVTVTRKRYEVEYSLRARA